MKGVWFQSQVFPGAWEGWAWEKLNPVETEERLFKRSRLLHHDSITIQQTFRTGGTQSTDEPHGKWCKDSGLDQCVCLKSDTNRPIGDLPVDSSYRQKMALISQIGKREVNCAVCERHKRREIEERIDRVELVYNKRTTCTLQHLLHIRWNYDALALLSVKSFHF